MKKLNLIKNSKLLIVFLSTLLVLLSGCDSSTSQAEYHRTKVKCSEEQLLMVRKQMEICTDTGYRSSLCYDRARMEQCDLVEDQKEN